MNSLKLAFIWSAVFVLSGCGGPHMPIDKLPSTKPTQMDSQPSFPRPNYTQDIFPLFREKCSLCHKEGTPIGNWLDYNQVVEKQKLILLRVVEKKDMPLGGQMDENQRAMVELWIKNNLPYGPEIPL